ncbi:MAG: hypothetical protein WC333_01480 [Dehalococcoidia bacterium]|jgi:vacuolar-type H+-ATPase subunit F/Vma7
MNGLSREELREVLSKPPHKPNTDTIICSEKFAEALKKALDDYENNRKSTIKKDYGRKKIF